jgi:hypothetical protein
MTVMISHELLEGAGILIVSPEGPLETKDFETLAQQVDPYLEQKGQLNGLMIQAESFPGWHNFGALISHLSFVRGHHQRIKKVAAVSDGTFVTIMPKVAQHFVAAEIRHFDYDERGAALAWLQE